jgi:hypothetical protein
MLIFYIASRLPIPWVLSLSTTRWLDKQSTQHPGYMPQHRPRPFRHEMPLWLKVHAFDIISGTSMACKQIASVSASIMNYIWIKHLHEAVIFCYKLFVEMINTFCLLRFEVRLKWTSWGKFWQANRRSKDVAPNKWKWFKHFQMLHTFFRHARISFSICRKHTNDMLRWL